MPNTPRVDKVEYERRIRIVQEWLVDDWPYQDVISQIIKKWDLEERQAKRYIKCARERWSKAAQAEINEKLARRIESLQKLKRSMKAEYIGTPAGMHAQLAVEKEIIKLEGIAAPQKLEHSGKDGKPLMPTETVHRVIFEDYGGA
ncbi:hypothetical protein SAMN05444266_101628 [Chitinophaga jiangningensis]|uniref:Uncharacterized protein n=1 Tax=Chitinophaga jiangningensis TaxID=1419482 RepID=A0A1M6WHL3_9BACT|nr:hypothetical protein [Chitinophaga jiangningensis]SHK93178.1 hypothetical protein SAMN05444266_101628 [Chitinophaga jiangningensis]